MSTLAAWFEIAPLAVTAPLSRFASAAPSGVGGGALWALLALATVLPATAAGPQQTSSAAPAQPAVTMPGSSCPVPAAKPAATTQPSALLGPITREQLEAAEPSWVQAGVEAKPDLEATRALASVPPGAEVTVLLGSWCGDSRREVSRLWRALDGIGASAAGGAGGGLPFTITYIGVDEAKKQPVEAVTAAGLRYVPTFIVRRDGREVGRIVERSPHGIESDLLALLDGKASGLLTASTKMTAEGSAAPHHP
jgi:hypothetical protein